MKFIKCTIQDIETLQQVCIQTFIETFQDYNTKEDMDKFISTAYSNEQLKKELQDTNSVTYLIGDDDSNALGFLKLNKDSAQTEKNYPNSLEIQRIYVLKQAKGKGVGTQFMTLAEQVAKEWSLDYIWLGVWEHNTKAIAFYLSKGYEKIDEHVFMLGDDKQIDYILKKDI